MHPGTRPTLTCSYVVVKARSQKHKTETMYINCNPVFDEEIFLHCEDPSTVLHVCVMDEDPMKTDDMLGQWIMTCKWMVIDPTHVRGMYPPSWCVLWIMPIQPIDDQLMGPDNQSTNRRSAHARADNQSTNRRSAHGTRQPIGDQNDQSTVHDHFQHRFPPESISRTSCFRDLERTHGCCCMDAGARALVHGRCCLDTCCTWNTTARLIWFDLIKCVYNKLDVHRMADGSWLMKGWFPLYSAKWRDLGQRGEIEMEVQWRYVPGFGQGWKPPVTSAMDQIKENSNETKLRLGDPNGVKKMLKKVRKEGIGTGTGNRQMYRYTRSK